MASPHRKSKPQRLGAGSSPQRSLTSSVSLPAIPSSSSRSIYGRQWTTENKRLLHELRERSWLRQQGKYNMVDFSDQERAELRQYFDAIAEIETEGKQRRVRIDRLEDMLISLGLAQNKFEVAEIVRDISDDENVSGELDFEQFLMIVRTRHPSLQGIFQVFKAMIDGQLGDRQLNFRTVLSGYRRRMIVDATGVTDFGLKPTGDQEFDRLKKQETKSAQTRGKRILENFANLQRGRFERGEVRGARGETGEDSMPFDGSGFVPTGGMQMLWHSVCGEHNLTPSRPASADKRTLEPPRSPREIIESIVQADSKRCKKKKGTLVIGAPESINKVASNPELRTASRPSTQEGKRELSTKFALLQ